MGNFVQVVFFVGALGVLAIVLYSTTLRARLKVFVVKHFFRNRYDYRAEWLRLIKTLSHAEGGRAGPVLIRALAQMVASPGGLLWCLDEKEARYRLIAQFGSSTKMNDIAKVDPLVEFMRKENWLIDLHEFHSKKGHYRELQIPSWLDEIESAWLVIPLFSASTLRGFMLLLEPKSVRDLNYEDRDLLKTAGQHIAVHLAQQESDRLLAEAQQFETFNRLTAFLMHDLKNLMAQQSLIVRNAKKHKHNPEFIDDAIETIANSVERMNKVMDHLKRDQEMGLRRNTPVKYAVSNAVDRCSGNKPAPRISLENEEAVVSVDSERFSMVLQHLIRNAQQATSQTGDVELTVRLDGDMAHVVVADNGSGMEPEFVSERLFKPFDSTKGSEGMGIGAHQAREFAREMGGDMVVSSRPGEGTIVDLYLPAITEKIN